MPIGAFGKYPAKRDFVVVNLPRNILQPIENWLRSAVSTSRETLGMRWQEHYMIQPVWNFSLGSRIAGSSCLGSIVPSVDGVGRPFPLVILGYAGSPQGRFESLDTADSDAWFLSIHERLMLALSDDPPREAADLVTGLEEPPLSTASPSAGLEAAGEGIRSFWGDAGREDAAAQIREWHEMCRDDARSVWWCAGGGFVAPQTVSFHGMPDADFMAQMMASSQPSSAVSSADFDPILDARPQTV